RRRHTRFSRDWSSDVCSSDLFVPNCFPPRSLEALMKAILSAAMVLGLCGLAGARDEKANPVGTWQCEYKIGDLKRMSTLTIKKRSEERRVGKECRTRR